jgi:His-Xaa-Ser system radical SAM maturase HxsC
MAIPLVLKADNSGFSAPAILKAVTPDEFVRHGWPPHRSVLLLDSIPETARAAMLAVPWAAVLTSDAPTAVSGPTITHLRIPNAIQAGDVVEVVPGRPTLRVLYRRGDNGNVLFATERCNSYCLMCSQPPRDVDDRWRVSQLLDLIDLIDRDEPSLAITGGEPTLLGNGLVAIIERCKTALPDTDLQVLTNGRLLAQGDLARRAADVGHPKLQWNVPLYADVAPIHDYVVQSQGAFVETVSGLYRLAEAGQAIEIRVVLHRPTIPRLAGLVRFIYRNLSFVRHVALMGIEPIGFARANYASLWIDPVDYQSELAFATTFLHDRGMNVSLYNLPLCVLPRSLWPWATRSISNWKNTFPPECADCRVRTRCAGFFASTDEQWASKGIRPILAEEGTA